MKWWQVPVLVVWLTGGVVLIGYLGKADDDLHQKAIEVCKPFALSGIRGNEAICYTETPAVYKTKPIK